MAQNEPGNTATLERGAELTDSPMMARLMDALKDGTDVGHYGRLVFCMVAHHFMDDEKIVKLLTKQPEQDEAKVRAMLAQVEQRDYNPPKRERILAWQAEQDFQIIDPDDPNDGNLYRELQFPDQVYENINEFYEEQAENGAGR